MSTTFLWGTATLDAQPLAPRQQPQHPPSAKWACTDSKAASPCPTHRAPAIPAGISSPSYALTQLLQPLLLFLSPLSDALRLLSQPVRLGNCSIAIGRPVSLLQHKHSVPGPSHLPCCLCSSTATKTAPPSGQPAHFHHPVTLLSVFPLPAALLSCGPRQGTQPLCA